MSFSVINGYAPRDFDTLLAECVVAVNNEFGTSYTAQTFVGTKFWKFYYTQIQLAMSVENATAQLGVKLQDYIRTQNEALNEVKSSVDGFMLALERENGYISSQKPTEEADAGHIYLAIDIDPLRSDYDDVKKEIFNVMHRYHTAGLFYEGTEQGQVVAVNGQSFNYAFELPMETLLKVKVTVTVSDNTTLFVESTNKIKERWLNNFKKLYRLGYDFEPDKYLTTDELKFASEIKTEYSTNGGTDWKSDVLDCLYNEKIVITEENLEIEVI